MRSLAYALSRRNDNALALINGGLEGPGEAQRATLGVSAQVTLANLALILLQGFRIFIIFRILILKTKMSFCQNLRNLWNV